MAALALLDQHPEIALMFSDVVMPGGMTGYDLAREAKRRRPDLLILLASGYTSKSKIAVDLDTQGLQVLQKPFRMHELAVKLRHLLDKA